MIAPGARPQVGEGKVDEAVVGGRQRWVPPGHAEIRLGEAAEVAAGEPARGARLRLAVRILHLCWEHDEISVMTS